jgi:hypothetical protein
MSHVASDLIIQDVLVALMDAGARLFSANVNEFTHGYVGCDSHGVSAVIGAAAGAVLVAEA